MIIDHQKAFWDGVEKAQYCAISGDRTAALAAISDARTLASQGGTHTTAGRFALLDALTRVIDPAHRSSTSPGGAAPSDMTTSPHPDPTAGAGDRTPDRWTSADAAAPVGTVSVAPHMARPNTREALLTEQVRLTAIETAALVASLAAADRQLIACENDLAEAQALIAKLKGSAGPR